MKHKCDYPKQISATIKPLFFIVISFSLLLFPSFGSSDSYTISFHKTTFADPYDIQLDFKGGIVASFPSELSAGQSEDISIRLDREMALATSTYEPFLPQEKTFLTPLGDSPLIKIATFVGELVYYIKLVNASVLAEITIEGNATASPTSVTWSSEGTKYFTIQHIGFGYSEETITLQISFQYMASLTVLSATVQGIIVSEKTQKIQLNGTETISQSLQVIPQTPDTLAPDIANIIKQPSSPTYNNEVIVNASVTDNESGVREVNLLYSTNGGNNWTKLTMSHIKDSVYSATIPRQANGTSVQYYIEAFDNAGNHKESSWYSYTIGSDEDQETLDLSGIPLWTIAVAAFILFGLLIMGVVAIIYFVRKKRMVKEASSVSLE